VIHLDTSRYAHQHAYKDTRGMALRIDKRRFTPSPPSAETDPRRRRRRHRPRPRPTSSKRAPTPHARIAPPYRGKPCGTPAMASPPCCR
jgi:hypothetical protein